ncbi:MAG: hypothetical protein AB7H77_01315 [Bdellovibrionales bacterium]
MPMRKIMIAALLLLAAPGLAGAAEAPLPGRKPEIMAPAPVLPPAENLPPAPEAAALPAATYFPILPYEAGDETPPQLLPVASNHPLEGAHPGIARAVIVIHDETRNAAGALGLITTLAGRSNPETLVLAPQFLLATDIARFAGHLPDEGRNIARWGLGGWEDGGDSINPAQKRGISSFTAIDLLLIYLAQKSFFPDLQTITVTGHGAGGDFVLRYAAAGQAPDILETQNIPVRFVPANPSSYLYFTAARPVAGKPNFAPPRAEACPGYNAWKYGISNLNAYARRRGGSAIRLDYPMRRVTYLAGKQATGGLRETDNSCAALLQGSDRLARAQNYARYIETIFGEDAARRQFFAVITEAGFDAGEVYASSCGASVLFGAGEACGPQPVRGAEIP